MGFESPILIDVPTRFDGRRVVLRLLADDDADAVQAAIDESREHLQPYLPFYRQDLDGTREYIRRCQARYLLRDGFDLGIFGRGDDCGHYLGGVGLHVLKWGVPSFEIGYWLRRTAEGHGYVGDAVRLLTAFAFDHFEAERLVIRCHAGNTRSRAVAERCGYQFEGCLRREGLDTTGMLRDTLVFGMIREDYEQARMEWQP